MNKGQLIDAVASELGLSKAAAARTVDTVINCVIHGIKTESRGVTIVGFGAFTKRTRAARTGRNPVTGEPMHINASTTVGFKASQSLKDALTSTSPAGPSSALTHERAHAMSA
jgi:DNA-binding protein HU-beta